MSDDWFRNIKWDEKEKLRFFERLKKSRGNFYKAQYARIKAYGLLQTKKKKLVLGSIELCNLIVEKYPEESQLASCFLQLAEAYALIGEKEKAAQYFEKCLDQEKIFPNIQTSVVTVFPEFIVQNKLQEYYDKALESLQFGKERTGGYTWPYQFFLFYGLQALIHFYRNENEKAKSEAYKAVEYSKQKQSSFRYHQELGLVPQSHWLINKLKKIK
jgi:hypothetical protein